MNPPPDSNAARPPGGEGQGAPPASPLAAEASAPATVTVATPEGHLVPCEGVESRPVSVAPEDLTRGIAVDLGCGLNKAPWMVGVDALPGEGVDHVVNLDAEPLPFADDSVELIFSSNTFEHLREVALLLLKEIPRVLMDRGLFEIWTPRTFHNNAHVLGHTFFWNEEPWLHMCRAHRDYWTATTGTTWNLTRLVFICDPRSLASAQALGFSPGLAIRHLNNVVTELGVIGHIDKPGVPGSPAPPLDVYYSVSREPAHYHPLDSPVWW